MYPYRTHPKTPLLFSSRKRCTSCSFANYSVEGNDGYKLYDDAAVEKLQQIALYYQLGLKRNEIRDIMLNPDYDRNRTLENLLEREQTRKVQIERHIAVLEYLKMIGLKNGLAGAFCNISLDELGQILLNLRESEPSLSQLPQALAAFERNFLFYLMNLAACQSQTYMIQKGRSL